MGVSLRGCVGGDVCFEVGELDDERGLPALLDFGADDDMEGRQVLDVFGGPFAVGADVGGDLARGGHVRLGEGDQRRIGEEVVPQCGAQLLGPLGGKDRPDAVGPALVSDPGDNFR